MKNYFIELFDLSIGARRFILSEAFFGISVGIFTMLLNLHLLALGINELEIGEILSAGNIVVGIACIPAVFLANYFGRKAILSLGACLMGIAYFLFGFSNQIWALYLAQIVLSFGITFIITTEIQLLFSYCRTKSEETKCYNLVFAAFTLFVGIGTLIGGFLPHFFSGLSTNYQGPIYCASFVLFITAIVRFAWLPNIPVQEVQVKSNIQIEKLKKVNRIKHLVFFSIFAAMSGFLGGWILSFLNIIVKFRLDWTDEKVSYLLTIQGFFLFFGSILVPYLFHKLGITKSFVFVFAANIIIALVLSIILPNYLLIALLLCRGGFTIMLSNMIAGQSMSAIEEVDRNLFAGLWSISINLGISVSTYLTGHILNEKNYTLSFFCSAISIVFTFIYFYYWIRPILLKNNDDTNTLPSSQIL